MMAKGSSKVQAPEKAVKKKSCKPRVKKDAGAPNPPGQDKVKKKKASPKKLVPSPPPQKERNGAQQIKRVPAKNSPRTSSSTHVSQASTFLKREKAQVSQIKSPRSPAPERKKEPEPKLQKRRQQPPSDVSQEKIFVPLIPTIRSILMPPQAPRRPPTISRAHAHLLEMAHHSRFDIPQAHQQHHHVGLSALASELPQVPEQVPEQENIFGKKGFDGSRDAHSPGGGGDEKKAFFQEDVTQFVFTEVSESTEPRFITPKEVALFQDWRPGAPNLDKPPTEDRNHWLAVEIGKQHDRRVTEKLGKRKKQVRYLEGVGEDTPLSRDASQMIADFTIREDIPKDIEQSARGYAEFLYRPGAAWMNLGSASTSLRSFEQPEPKARPMSCEARKTTEEIVLAISSASLRREAMRNELAERLRQDLLRKKLLVSQTRSATKRSQCRCC